MLTPEDRARWRFPEENATWHQAFCKEQNRNRCNAAQLPGPRKKAFAPREGFFIPHHTPSRTHPEDREKPGNAEKSPACETVKANKIRSSQRS